MTLTDEIDVSRGDLLAGPDERPSRAHDVDAMVVWMSEVGDGAGSAVPVADDERDEQCIRHGDSPPIDINTLDEHEAGLARIQRHRPLRNRLRPRIAVRSLRR